jgi:uncharacterized membrane protein
VEKDRLQAFSDGVIAILITIMVLELREPRHLLEQPSSPPGCNPTDHRRRALGQHAPAFLAFAVPVLHGLDGRESLPSLPTAAYGCVLLLAAIAYFILTKVIIAAQGPGSTLEAALGSDAKGKLSPVIYAIAIPIAFLNQWVSLGMYVFVSLMWLVPDRRIESKFYER